ncbi:MAG: ROK family transcriptional regulator [Bacteroidales bacterium]|nr:ROK family transcriptional regulator [Bacteroidales bacterium]
MLNLLLKNADLTKNNSNTDQKRIRQQSFIVEYLYRNGPTSNPELAKLTNMSSPTINKLLVELMGMNLVLELGFGDSIGGRRPNLYGINPNAKYIISIDIDCRMIKMGVFNLQNEAVSDVVTYFDNVKNKSKVFDEIFNRLDTMLRELSLSLDQYLGVGISLPGLIEAKTGETFSDLKIDEQSLESFFMQRYKLPTFIGNDSRVMALGEQVFGAAKNKENVLCINICDGIGMGMIVNGKIYEGKSGYAGELGHINVVEDGLLCTCGKKGCLETVASGTALIEHAQKGILEGKQSVLVEMVANNLDDIHVSTIIDAVHNGDAFAIELISQAGYYLGKGIAGLIHIFNPEAIIIGGKVASAKHFLLDSIQQSLNKYTIYRLKQDTEIIASELGGKVKLLGAVAMVMNRLFEQEKEFLA